MIRRLRRRFFLLCAGMTGMVLLLLMAALCGVLEREYREMGLRRQQELAGTLRGRLQSGKEIENSWLGRLEWENRAVISIQDNGVPFHFRGGWQPETPRAVLLDRMAERGEETVPFLLKGERGEAYRCIRERMESFPGSYELTLLFSLREEERALWTLRGRFLLAGMLGLLVLAACSGQLARLAVRPTEASLRAQNAFVAAAGHEMRSPLAVMSASASAILFDPSKTRRYVQAITGECRRLGRLADDLLLLAKADAPGFAMQREEICLDTLLIETAERLTPLARAQGHPLHCYLPDEEELPAVYGDALQLRQAVENLVSNAVCHAGGEGSIELVAAREGHRVRIAVIDHGRGIADAEKERVFERFARGDSARSNRSHSGLGLSIVREIVRLHGGQVMLEDTPGGGCTFLIRLPGIDERPDRRRRFRWKGRSQ
ncbi:MAG: HAMP domain-containing histidine kinase [Provencibacterium sp.]|jgi:OmpR-family two-component system manganese-sensing sensor histidine kinase|nr:HAMP domain-containing histidine kinase [Provencibacterium sp.]